MCLDDERIYFLLSCRHKGPFECRTELLAGPCIFMENPDRGGSCSDTGGWGDGGVGGAGGACLLECVTFPDQRIFLIKVPYPFYHAYPRSD